LSPHIKDSYAELCTSEAWTLKAALDAEDFIDQIEAFEAAERAKVTRG
jgi:hypothetical protein